MAERTVSACAVRWGMCMRDPHCPDRACEGHPVQSCSSCRGGPCPTPEACHVPIAEVRPITRRLFANGRRFTPATRDAWGRVIGALLGLGGFLLFLNAFAQKYGVL